MAIEFRCSQCNQLLRVPDDSAGKNARCPKCQSLMTVPAASSPVSTPAASSPASTNPFAAGESPPPKPASPFGDTSPTTSNLNPYASPSGGFGYQPTFPAGDRPGLPWETQGQNFSTWWETTKLCMNQPSYAFRIMRLSGGIGQPMLFAAMGMAVGFVGQLIWNIPLIVVLGIATDQSPGEIGFQIATTIGQGIFAVAVGATVGVLISAALIHLSLMLLGGARQPFEATLRVVGFAQGATAWLQVIPVVGALIAAIWGIVAEVVGIAQAHEIPTGKALLAVLLPIIVCCLSAVAIAVILGFSLAAASGAFR